MEKKQYFFMILIPAIIAGLFAFAPTIYQKITEPKVKFCYSISQGPVIQDNSSYKKIIVVTLYNAGQKKINNIIGQLIVDTGTIKAYSFKDTNLINPKIANNTNKISFNILSMLPSDSLALSLLVESNNENPIVNMSIRSDEILAIENSSQGGEKTIRYPSYLSAILAALSVLLMSLVATRSKLFQKTVLTVIKNNKNDLLFYLSILLQDDNISQAVMKDETISYMRMSDLIHQSYIATKNDNYKKGQFCLFIIKEMADTSKNIVKINLSKMNLPEISADDEKMLLKHIKNDYINMRNEFDLIFKLGIDEYIK